MLAEAVSQPTHPPSSTTTTSTTSTTIDNSTQNNIFKSLIPIKKLSHNFSIVKMSSVDNSINEIFKQYSKNYSDIEITEPVLKYDDFVSICTNGNDSNIKNSKLSFLPLDSYGLLFLIADTNKKGFLTINDFNRFSKELLEVQDTSSEYKLLFKLFKSFEKDIDSNSNSNSPDSKTMEINKFITILSNINGDKNTDFQSVLNYIKSNNLKQIDFVSFQKLITDLTINKFNDKFDELKKIDLNTNENRISVDTLKLIISNVYNLRLPENVLNQIGLLSKTYFPDSKTNGLNHHESVQILKLLQNLPRLNYLIYQQISTSKIDPIEKPITQDDFLEFLNSKDSGKNLNNEDVSIFFHWNALLLQKQQSFSSIKKGDLLAILTDDMITTSESADRGFNMYPVFNSAYSFLLGSVAGAIGATIVYPIDLVKTRMQNQKGNSLYSSYGDCFRKVIKNEGAVGMYSGLLPQLVGVAPEKAIKLTVNDIVRGIGSRMSENGEITMSWEIIAGCSAGAAQVVFTNPLEITKIRLQVQGETKRQFLAEGKPFAEKTAVGIVKELGFRGLYKGAFACLSRDVPFSAIYFPTYANLKKYLFNFDPKDPSKRKNLESWELLVSGALAGMPAAYFTTPFDVIKTRLQVEKRPGDKIYKNIPHAFKTILKEEGASAFFKGGLARICRSSPQFGFTLASYELFQTYVPLNRFYADPSDVSSSPSSDFKQMTSDGKGNSIKMLTPSTVSNADTTSSVKYGITEAAKRFVNISLDFNPSLKDFNYNSYIDLQSKKKD